MRKIYNQIKFLIFCWYKGHKFGTVRFHKDSEESICARCGYKRKKKFRTYYDDDFFIY
jgi:ribosomal protein L37E